MRSLLEKAMEICNAKTRRRLLLLFFVLVLHIVASCFAEEPNKAPERPSFGKFVQETVSVWKKSHQTSWDKIKSLMHQMQLQFFPPNLDFRSRDETNGRKGMVDDVKEAMEKSFGASKDAVQESAKSAAKAMEEAVHKTADKVKENLADKDKVQHSHDEL